MANEKDKQKKATSQKGTTYTQVNDSTYNWNAPTGYGVIHLDPNSGGPWGAYHVYQGSAGPDEERRLSEDGLAPHLQNINTLEFKYPDPWWLPLKEYVAPRWNKLIDKAKIEKNGGWLTKYQLGGEAPQQTQAEDKQLLALITSAYKEVASGKLGESFMYVAQLLQDSQGAAKLDSLRTQIPELEEMLSAIEEVAFQQSAYMKKGGCAKKKKVKKGAKGCVPCKKLMKVGGKLVNVLTDCEGNIISRHQAGGWLVPKGEGGLTAEQKAMLDSTQDLSWARQQAASISTNTAKEGKHYYKGADGVYEVSALKGLDGTYQWGNSRKLAETEYANLGITKNGNNYTRNGSAIGDLTSLGNAYNTQVTAAGPIQYTDGTNWFTSTAYLGADGQYHYGAGVAAKIGDFNTDDFRQGITMNDFQAGKLTRDQATAAGIDVSQFDIEAPTVRGVRGKAGNSLLGETASGPTAQDYIDQYGFAGALQNEARLQSARLLSAKNDRRAARRAAWKHGLVGEGQLKAIRQEYRDTRDEINSQHRAQAAALLNRYTSRNHSTIGAQGLTSGTMTHTQASTGSSTGSQPAEYTIMKRQGGWLNKF